MSDQIKVLSRDEVENLTESLVELVRHECRCGRTRFNFQHLPEVSRALDWIEMDIEKALREKLAVETSEKPKRESYWRSVYYNAENIPLESRDRALVELDQRVRKLEEK